MSAFVLPIASAEASLARVGGKGANLIVARLFPIVTLGIGALFLLQRLLAKWLGLAPGAGLELMRGLPGNVTTEMDLYLWSRVQAIRADPAARPGLLERPTVELVDAYRRGTLREVAQRAIAQFLDRYGVRGVAEIDFGRPRWSDDPTPVVQMIHNYLQLDDPALAPDLLFQRGTQAAEQLAVDLVTRARGLRLGWLRARVIGALIRRLRALASMRESPKFYIIQQFGVYHAALLDHGRGLAARGQLEQAEDIFLVPFARLRHFANGEPIDLRAVAAAQRAEHARDCERRRMPRLLLSTGETFYEGMSEAGATDLVGDPVSPGVVEGRARVVLDERGVRLKPGEILVCPATDPGWAPLFLTAGGLLIEIGGMVTHGSVVTREYGNAAVVGVDEATARILTGQRIRVDGTQGRVMLLEEVPATQELVTL
jgi:phosphohistidine swiveling domain-containing protein